MKIKILKNHHHHSHHQHQHQPSLGDVFSPAAAPAGTAMTAAPAPSFCHQSIVERYHFMHDYIIPIDQLERYIEDRRPRHLQHQHQHSKQHASHIDDGFAIEYQSLYEIDSELNGASKRRNFRTAMLSANAARNRYASVLANEQTRVKLTAHVLNSDLPYSDYINANYISAQEIWNIPRNYVLTQAPLLATVPEFWLCVWQNRSPVIAVVSSMRDLLMGKSCRFWPGNASFGSGCEGGSCGTPPNSFQFQFVSSGSSNGSPSSSLSSSKPVYFTIVVSFIEEMGDFSDLIPLHFDDTDVNSPCFFTPGQSFLHAPELFEDIHRLRFRVQSWETDALQQGGSFLRNYEEFEVDLLQYDAWPDHSIPSNMESFFMYHQLVDSAMGKALAKQGIVAVPASPVSALKRMSISTTSSGDTLASPSSIPPLTVMCSAGIGRSGTFVLVDVMTQKFQKHLSGLSAGPGSSEDFVVDLHDTAAILRQIRSCVIDGRLQYAFAYECLLHEYKERKLEFTGRPAKNTEG